MAPFRGPSPVSTTSAARSPTMMPMLGTSGARGSGITKTPSAISIAVSPTKGGVAALRVGGEPCVSAIENSFQKSGNRIWAHPDGSAAVECGDASTGRVWRDRQIVDTLYKYIQFLGKQHARRAGARVALTFGNRIEAGVSGCMQPPWPRAQ